MYKLLVISLVFLLGFYFIYKSNDVETFTPSVDNVKNKITEKCPDVLIQKGAAFFLYNSKRANVPGVNPIRFDSLEEYVEFTEWQRSQGILCPILYLQHAYDAQGEPVYKARPSPTNMQGGQPDYVVTPADLPGMQEVQINAGAIQANMIPPPLPGHIQGIYSPQPNMPIPNIPPMQHMPPPLQTMMPPTYSGNTYCGYDEQNQTIGLNTPLDQMFNQTKGVSPNPMDTNWGGVEYTENLLKSGYYKGNEVSKSGFKPM
jgi:hypothetical protein